MLNMVRMPFVFMPWNPPIVALLTFGPFLGLNLSLNGETPPDGPPDDPILDIVGELPPPQLKFLSGEMTLFLFYAPPANTVGHWESSSDLISWTSISGYQDAPSFGLPLIEFVSVPELGETRFFRFKLDE